MIVKRLLEEYKNGNCKVKIYSDGTKIRWTEDDEFFPEFPESIDLKITNRCDRNCPMCHECSTADGKHAKLNLPFLSSLKRGTELAIGGGNPLSHPNLVEFLERMKSQGVICNLTINQVHLEKDLSFVQELIDKNLVYGLGISYTGLTDKLLEFCEKNKNVVIHLIIGIHSLKNLDELSNKNLKLLFLGYKQFGKGKAYYSPEIERNIDEIRRDLVSYNSKFKILSFDNLSYEQLQIPSKITKEEKELHYMGDDGQFTMYIDAVEEKYAKNSIAPISERFDLLSDITAMFKSLS